MDRIPFPRAARARLAGRRLTLPAALGLVIAALVAAHYAVLVLRSGLDVETKGLLATLDLFEERSVGTWVNAALLAGAAVAAAALAAATTQEGRLRRGWWALGALAFAASVDEVAGFHESVVEAVRSAIALPGFLLYAAWVLPAGVLVVAFALWQRRFFAMLPRRTARRIVGAGCLYVGAAAGLEVLESQLLSSAGRDWTPLLQAIVGVEEGLEMGAAAIVLVALLAHLAATCPSWALTVHPRGQSIGVAPGARHDDEPRWTRDVAATRPASRR